ncbi:flagellar assembly protein FliW [Actinosynnema pretiosum]|uniref:Flagellar assembly factor FliW n=1 Tax=Actinosynnema pretiosum TaxID=42197 RepID=A0A290Z4M3_9PSEU|nr:flagellar assembly protein FliW [Actinosynnema pretiosum]ATE53934.1 flagellar assembly protein FliW [Actinosynnema pretiosum]
MTAVLERGARTTSTTVDEQLPTIEFVTPLPGFPHHRTFVLVSLHEEGLLYALRSADDPGLRFLVVPPAPFFPDYAPVVGEEALDQLGTREADNLLPLLVVTAGDKAAGATANLLAPIVVDQRSRRAVQVVQADDLPTRAPLARDVPAPNAGGRPQNASADATGGGELADR